MSGAERERPKVAATTLGQPKTMEANGNPPFAHTGETCNRERGASRSRARRPRRYTGKHGRAPKLLESRPASPLMQPENWERAA